MKKYVEREGRGLGRPTPDRLRRGGAAGPNVQPTDDLRRSSDLRCPPAMPEPLTATQVQHVAKLARLRLTSDQVERFLNFLVRVFLAVLLG